VRGGTERHLLLVLPELARRGYDITLFVLHRGGALEPDFAARGIVVRYADRTLGSLSAWVWLWRRMRRLRPSIVHCFLPEAYILGAMAALAARCRVLVMSRRGLNDYRSRRRIAARFEPLLHRHMTAILANSKASLRELEQEGAPPHGLRLIYNGIDTASLDAAPGRYTARRALGIEDDILVLCVVANLIPYKGHGDLLQALAIAAKSLGNWRLLCAGRDDGSQANLELEAQHFGIADRIVWLGERSDIPGILAASDIAVLSPVGNEGFSNAILEAMAASLPVVATRIGGNAEAVVDGETGLLVAARDPIALAAAIVALAQDPTKRTAFGRAGRIRVAEHFSLSACCEAYDALYRVIAAPKN